MKDEIVRVLNLTFEAQKSDYEKNDPVKKFFKKVANSLVNVSDSHDVQAGKLYLNLSKLEEYFRVKRVELDVTFETYVQYCDDY